MPVPLINFFLPHCGIAIRRNFVPRLAFQPERLGNQTQGFAGYIYHQQVLLALHDLPVGRGRCRMSAGMVLFWHVCVLHFVCRKEILELPVINPSGEDDDKEN